MNEFSTSGMPKQDSLSEINPGMKLKIGHYTVTVRAEYLPELKRNETADFLNWLSFLLGPTELEMREKDAKAWSGDIYNHLKKIGIYDQQEETE